MLAEGVDEQFGLKSPNFLCSCSASLKDCDKSMKNKLFFLQRQELALVGVTIISGAGFHLINEAMNHVGPMFFVGLRLLIASLVLFLLFARAMRNITPAELMAGALIGMILAVGNGLQTMGMQTISGSMSAFITALYVPMVPLLQWPFFRRRIGAGTLFAVVLCFVGLILFSAPEGEQDFSFSAGVWSTLGAAFIFAFGILLLGLLSPKFDMRRFAFLQLAFGSLFAFFFMPILGETLPELSHLWFYPVIITGISAAVIQLTMTWAQKTVSPTRAAVIYTGDPVWAGIVGWLVLGELFTRLGFMGAALIFIGILTCELFQARQSAKEAEATAS